MTARIGELAIARFDSDVKGKKYEEHVCVVTEYHGKSELKFVWWERHGRGATTITSTLPRCRLIRARPCGAIAQLKIGSGELSSVTLQDVRPI